MQFVDGLEIFRISDSVISSDEKILFFSPDSAFFRRWSPWGLDVRKSGDTLRFKSDRVIEVPNDAILSINPLFKHKMNIVDIGVNLPWSETSWASPILTAYGNYSKLELPGLSYKVVKTDRISSEDRIYQRGFSGKAFNEFDQSYIQTIRSTDTLAIEEYFYIFEKK